MHSYGAECQKQSPRMGNEKPVSVQQFLVAPVDIDFHTERNPKRRRRRREGRNCIDTERDPRGSCKTNSAN